PEGARPRARRPSGGGKTPPQPRRTRRRHSWLGGLAKLLILLVLWAVIIGAAALGYFALTLPDTSQLATAERRPSVTILAEDSSLIASFGDLFGRALTLKEVSP